MVHDVPGRLRTDERLAPESAGRPCGPAPPAGELERTQLGLALPLRARAVDVAEAQPPTAAAELPGLDPELVLDPGRVVAELLAEVDLSQL